MEVHKNAAKKILAGVLAAMMLAAAPATRAFAENAPESGETSPVAAAESGAPGGDSSTAQEESEGRPGGEPQAPEEEAAQPGDSAAPAEANGGEAEEALPQAAGAVEEAGETAEEPAEETVEGAAAEEALATADAQPDFTNPNVINMLGDPGAFTPDGAFSTLAAELMTTSTDAEADLRFYAELNDAWMKAKRDLLTGADPGFTDVNGTLLAEPLKKPSDPEFTSDPEGYYTYLNNTLEGLYLNGEPVFPPISFHATFDGTMDLPTPSSGEYSSNGVIFARYQWTQDPATGRVEWAVTYDPCVYAMEEVDITTYFRLPNADGGTGDGDATIAPGTAGESTGAVTFHSPNDPQKDPPENYAIDKSATNKDGGGKVYDSYVDYTITVTADKNAATARLNGKYVADALPSPFVLAGVAGVECFGADNMPVACAATETAAGDDAFSYTFPTGGKAIKKAVFTLRVCLSADGLAQYTQNPAAFSDVANTAELLCKEPTGAAPTPDTLATDTETVDKSAPMFTKGGSPVAANSRVVNWFLDLNTWGGGADNSFIVDTIGANHSYFLGDAGYKPVFIDKCCGGAVTDLAVVDLSSLDGTGPTYAELGAGGHHAGGDFDSLPYDLVGENECGTYTDHTGQEVIIFNTGGMLGHDVRISYYTYIEKPADVDVGTEPLDNSAKFQYDTYTYSGDGGDGQPELFGFELTEGVDVDCSWVTKQGYGYKADTQTVTWRFLINLYASTLRDLIVTDTLNENDQMFLAADPASAAYHADITLAGINGGADRTATYVAALPANPGNGTYYTFSDDGAGNTTFTLLVGGKLTSQDVYSMELPTRLRDGTMLSRIIAANDKAAEDFAYNGNFTAEAKLSDENEDYTRQKAPATPPSQHIENELLEKRVDPANTGFNYQTRSTAWEVVVNPNFLPIAGATLRDVLPRGTTLLDLVSVEREQLNADGATTKTLYGSAGSPLFHATAPDSDTPANVSGSGISLGSGLSMSWAAAYTATPATADNTLDFAFGGTLADKLVLRFTTAYTYPAYRTTFFDTVPTPPVTNNVAFSGGTVYGEAVEQAAKTASNTKATKPIVKNGAYHTVPAGGDANYGADYEGMCYVSWSTLVNVYAGDFTGFRVDDALKSFFELDTDSFKIYDVTLNPDQSVATGGAVPDITKANYGAVFTDTDDYLRSNGFSFAVPSTYGSKTLLVTFNAILADAARARDMTNEATVTPPVGEPISTGDRPADGAQPFFPDDYFHAGGMPFISVKKVSVNPTNTAGDVFNFPLPGAVFTLEKIDTTTGLDASTRRTRATNTGGDASFFFLRPDTLYKLVETAPPAGYTINATAGEDVRYIYLTAANPAPTAGEIFSTYSGVLTGAELAAFTKANMDGRILVAPLVGDANGETLRLKNTPGVTFGDTQADFAFTKQGGAGGILPGAQFTLQRNTDAFTLFATADAGGEVRFAHLDPGTYTLTETGTATAPGFTWPYANDPANPPKWTVKVEFKNGNYEFTVTVQNAAHNHNTQSGKAQDGDLVLQNEYAKAAVTLHKVDGDNTAALAHGAEFTVYLKAGDVPVAYLVEGKTGGQPNGRYSLSNQNAEGNTLAVVEGGTGLRYLQGDGSSATPFKLLRGDYYCTETTTAPGYFPDEDTGGSLNQHAFTVGHTTTATITLSNTSPRSNHFTNECMSAAVVLLKADKFTAEANTGALPSSLVHGAQFTVYDAVTDDIVGYLLEDGATGAYRLSGEDGTGSAAGVTTGNAAGVPYLWPHPGDADNPLHLLLGKYYYEETITPDGYRPDDDRDALSPQLLKHYFEIGEQGLYYLDNTTGALPGGNAAGGVKAEFANESFSSQVLLVKQDLAAKADSNLDKRVAGAQFTVYRMPAGGYTVADPAADAALLVAYLTEAAPGGAVGQYALTNTPLAGHGTTAPATKTGDGVLCLQGGGGGAPFSLVPGEYYFVESVSPQGYFPDEDNTGVKVVHAFTVPEDGTDITLSNGGTADGHDAAGTDPDTRFANEYKSAPLRLNKRDFDNASYLLGAALLDAEFTVYSTNGTPNDDGDDLIVAYLVPDTAIAANHGAYFLSDTSAVDGAIAPFPKDGEGRYYLQGDATNGFTLLLGDYYFKETTTPEYYHDDTDDQTADPVELRTHRFTVESGDWVYLTNTGVAAGTDAGKAANGTANPYTAVFTNRNPAAPCTLLKRDDDDRNAPVHGVYFTVYAPKPDPDPAHRGKYMPGEYIPVAYLSEVYDAQNAPTGEYVLNSVASIPGDAAYDPENLTGLGKDAHGRLYLQTNKTPMQLIYSDDYFFVEGSLGINGAAEVAAAANFYPDTDANGELIRHHFTLHLPEPHYLTNGGTNPASADRFERDASCEYAAAPNEPAFTNRCMSAGIRLQKRDAVSTASPVAGAGFTVYTTGGTPNDESDDFAVATLKAGTGENAVKGTYTPAPLPAPDTTNRLFLWQHGAGQNTTWNLVPGKYYFIEDATPAGYAPDLQDPNDEASPLVRHTFTVDAHGVLYLSGTGAAYGNAGLIFTNTALTAQVELNKVDGESGEALAGAEFTVYDEENGSAVAYLAEAPAASGLPAGRYILSAQSLHGGADLSAAENADGRSYLQTGAGGIPGLVFGHYHIVETTTPKGYAAPEEPTGFTVAATHRIFLSGTVAGHFLDDGSLTGSALEEKIGATTFPNRYIMAEVLLDKRGGDAFAPLEGAEFKVYTNGANKLVAYLSETKNTEGKPIYMLSPKSLRGGKEIAPVYTADGRAYLNAEATGNTTVYRLVYGEYYFEETTAPEGYKLDLDKKGKTVRHRFAVDAAGLIYLANNDAKSGKQRVVFVDDPLVEADASGVGGAAGAGGAAGVQTGDGTPLGLLLGVCAVALAGIGVCGVVLYRRRKPRGGKGAK